MSRLFCWNDRGHEREGREDFERRGRPNRGMYRDPFDACSEAYFKGYDEARREEERRQERIEEERQAERRDEARRQERARELVYQAGEEEEYARRLEEEHEPEPEEPPPKEPHDDLA